MKNWWIVGCLLLNVQRQIFHACSVGQQLSSTNFLKCGFPNFWLWMYLMKIIKKKRVVCTKFAIYVFIETIRVTPFWQLLFDKLGFNWNECSGYSMPILFSEIYIESVIKCSERDNRQTRHSLWSTGRLSAPVEPDQWCIEFGIMHPISWCSYILQYSLLTSGWRII